MREGSGLTAASGGSNGERVFFGLAGSTLSGDADGDAADDRLPEKTLAIPFFDPAREAFLEYDIAKLLYELNQAHKPSIGIISSLPVDGNPVLGQPPWTVVATARPAVRCQAHRSGQAHPASTTASRCCC